MSLLAALMRSGLHIIHLHSLLDQKDLSSHTGCALHEMHHIKTSGMLCSFSQASVINNAPFMCCTVSVPLPCPLCRITEAMVNDIILNSCTGTFVAPPALPARSMVQVRGALEWACDMS